MQIEVDVDERLLFDKEDEDIDWNEIYEKRGQLGQIIFPEELYCPPHDFPSESRNSSLWNWVLKRFM